MPIIEFMNSHAGLWTYTIVVLGFTIVGAWHKARR